jgi:4-hydroxy-tetrahydrodipicolinate reductase
MADKTKVVISGAAGRMGGRLIHLAQADPHVDLVGVFEFPDHPSVGQPASEVVSLPGLDLTVAGSLEEVAEDADVLIEFTLPEPTMANLAKAAELGLAVVIGTTGLNREQLEELDALATGIPVVFSPNMSLGVNLMFKLVAEAAQALGDGYDLEIWEAHHRLKKDAPSGTAMRLYQILCEATGRDPETAGVYGRKGMVGERTDDEIGLQVIRAGDIVGEHHVLFGGLGETFEIVHRAHSRDTFARGGIRAARWVAGRQAGLYSMADVLGLK